MAINLEPGVLYLLAKHVVAKKHALAHFLRDYMTILGSVEHGTVTCRRRL